MIGPRYSQFFNQHIRGHLPVICVLIGLFGVAGLAQITASAAMDILAPNELFTVNRYLQEFFWYPTKPDEISRYCLSVAGFMAYTACVVLLFRSYAVSVAAYFREVSPIFLTINAICWLLVNLGLCQVRSAITPPFTLALTLPWIVLFFWPFLGSTIAVCIARLDERVLRLLSWSAIIIAIAQTIYVYEPFIFSKPALINEFMAIPEKTLLWKSPRLTGNPAFKLSDPIEVDNHVYLREHELLRPADRQYNLVTGDRPVSTAGIAVAPSLAISEFVENHAAVCYDGLSQRLFVVSPLALSELESLYRLMETDEQRRALANEIAEMQRYLRVTTNKAYSPQELEFIAANRREIQEQVLNRYVLHHHAHMFAPMNDMALDRPIHETHFLYGFLNAWALKEALIALYGDITYQGYTQLYFSFYLIYGIMFMVACLLLFRSPIKSALAFFSAVLTATAIGFDEIMLGPGGNPLRHAFDLPVILLVWGAVQNEGRRSACWWFAAFILSWVSMFNNREFGLFLSLSCVVCLSWFSLIEYEGAKRRNALMVAAISLAITAFSYHSAQIGGEGYGQYFLRGLAGFPFREWRMVPVLASCGLLAWMLMSNWSSPKVPVSPEVKIMCFISTLFFMLLTYYVWFPADTHLLTLSPLLSILGVLIADHLFARFNRPSWRTTSYVVLLALAAFLDVGAMFHYQCQRMKFNKIFARHHIYDWQFSRMRVQTTMDPAPFQSAIEMVQHHTSGPAMYLISKYDMVIPFLANRYSAMNFHEIGNFMITKRETDMIIELLRRDSPEVLFVDSDIDNPTGLDTIPPIGPFGPLHDESRWRALRLNLLSEVFDQVREDYELIDSGPLLSTWRRKEGHPKARNGN